jgi:hypothetical protein
MRPDLSAMKHSNELSSDAMSTFGHKVEIPIEAPHVRF